MVGPDTFVRIPKERVGILIGSEGKVKQEIENKLNIKLDIDKEGSVTITLPENVPDPAVFLRAKDLVTAIGRGFPPETAFRLIRNEDDIFDMIDLRLIFGRSESDITRVKGRIIGADGKEYGPVSADQVKQWIAAGRANGQSKVKREGTADWRPLAEFPE